MKPIAWIATALLGLILLACAARSSLAAEEPKVPWDERIGKDLPVFKYLVRQNKPQAWPPLKKSLRTLVRKHPDTTYAVDAKLLLAWGKASEENDTPGAIEDIRAVIVEHPDTPTVVEGPTLGNFRFILDPKWVLFTSTTRVTNPDGTVKIRPFPKGSAERFDGVGFNEARRYFEHLERWPRKAGDVGHLLIAALLLKEGRTDDAMKEFSAVIKSYEDPEAARMAPSWPTGAGLRMAT